MKIFILKYILIINFLITNALNFNSQTIYTLAGNGIAAYSGDSVNATSASFNYPDWVTVDGTGNVFVEDELNHRIRKITPTGIITTIAGNGSPSFSGDGSAAILAGLNYPHGITIDGLGNLYIADTYNHRVRKINSSGIISTIAGNGVAGYSGDGGAATLAKLFDPCSVAIDILGNIYIAETSNQRIRMIDPSGIITTIAGNGVAGYSGDGGSATSAKLNTPRGVSVDGAGNVYIADENNNRIRKVTTSGIISTIVGNGTGTFSGDGGLATNASINGPHCVQIDASGNLFIADRYNSRIRKVNTSGIISTAAGSSAAGFSGDGGLPTLAKLNNPTSVAVDALGNLFISDMGNHRIREVCQNGCYAGINFPEEKKNSVLIYPNPNNGTFKFQIENTIDSGEINIYNSIGELLFKRIIIQGENFINDVPNGFYHYIISDKNSNLFSGKIIIE